MWSASYFWNIDVADVIYIVWITQNQFTTFSIITFTFRNIVVSSCHCTTYVLTYSQFLSLSLSLPAVSFSTDNKEYDAYLSYTKVDLDCLGRSATSVHMYCICIQQSFLIMLRMSLLTWKRNNHKFLAFIFLKYGANANTIILSRRKRTSIFLEIWWPQASPQIQCLYLEPVITLTAVHAKKKKKNENKHPRKFALELLPLPLA